jgi:hypothetical protein
VAESGNNARFARVAWEVVAVRPSPSSARCGRTSVPGMNAIRHGNASASLRRDNGLSIVMPGRPRRTSLGGLVFHPPELPLDKGDVNRNRAVVTIGLLHPLCDARGPVLCLYPFLRSNDKLSEQW